MLIRDIFSYGISAIQRRKSRKGLSILGVTIGIAAIISIVSLSSGFQDLVNTQFEQGFSSNILIVTTESISFADTESDLKLYIDDTEIINNIDNIKQSTAILQRNCVIKIAEQEYILNVVGVDYDKYSIIFENTFNTKFGSIPKSPDNKSVIIGARVNDPWKNGSTLTSIGDEINITYTTRSGIDIENRTYVGRITGIMEEIGGTNIGGPIDVGVYIPLETAEGFFETDEVRTIIVQLTASGDEIIAQASDEIEAAFGNQIQVITPKSVLDAISSVIGTIELFVSGISAISLVVAGVGIMNTMLTSLMERVREIGILKALGMQKRTVLGIFLNEALIIGLLGSVFGILTGSALALSIDQLGLLENFTTGTYNTVLGEISIRPVFDISLFIYSFIFGIVISVIFGLYPAWRAAKMDPVEALRTE
ncbi:MAG: ABC transporter permease [Promethearchaeota archaeon]|nr:MAG: ABC transporter permease [Candidatus Lokiarchaeota archaeon]